MRRISLQFRRSHRCPGPNGCRHRGWSWRRTRRADCRFRPECERLGGRSSRSCTGRGATVRSAPPSLSLPRGCERPLIGRGALVLDEARQPRLTNRPLQQCQAKREPERRQPWQVHPVPSGNELGASRRRPRIIRTLRLPHPCSALRVDDEAGGSGERPRQGA